MKRFSAIILAGLCAALLRAYPQDAQPSSQNAKPTIWDYPARQPQHESLKAQFIGALRGGDTAKMADACRKGCELLPDDPTWHYNLACSLAYAKDSAAALDELEKAIDLGFRDADAIANDNDLKRLKANSRFAELVEYARTMSRRPVLSGPNAVTPATGLTGRSIAVGAQNIVWDFDLGVFDVKMSLAQATSGANTFDLYMNRDGDHARLVATNHTGLTEVRLDSDARAHGVGLDFPNMLFPYPVFGNCSRALTEGPFWRSIPRALMTSERHRMQAMHKFYVSNQIWAFPVVDDFNFATNKFGDVFASVSPYWIATEGRSWSDLPFLRAALEISASLKPAVKTHIVSNGMLAPTIQMILRMSLKSVKSVDDYFSAKSHPTCFAPGSLDMAKLKKFASSLKIQDVPPLCTIGVVAPANTASQYSKGEISYITPCSWAIVLRSDEKVREFAIKLAGGAEYELAAVHDPGKAASIRRIANDTFIVTIDKSRLTPTCRVDVAGFAKGAATVWSAPSFVSFAVTDPSAPYSDPALELQ